VFSVVPPIGAIQPCNTRVWAPPDIPLLKPRKSDRHSWESRSVQARGTRPAASSARRRRKNLCPAGWPRSRSQSAARCSTTPCRLSGARRSPEAWGFIKSPPVSYRRRPRTVDRYAMRSVTSPLASRSDRRRSRNGRQLRRSIIQMLCSEWITALKRLGRSAYGPTCRARAQNQDTDRGSYKIR
jgi:hypothetical protein